jgi:hypothetical protein
MRHDESNNTTLGGMIKLGGNPKPHGGGWLHDSLPNKTKCMAELTTLEVKIGGHRSIMASNPSPRVKITRYDSSKQEWKDHRSLLPILQLLRNERHHEEMGTYIS